MDFKGLGRVVRNATRWAHRVRAPCAGTRRVRAPWSAESSATARKGPRKLQRTVAEGPCAGTVNSQARKQCKWIA